tara:strand:+ start:476 stop:1690 length:1215 start_codon:yes stop_codon:yes gene_type:complete
MAEVKKARIFLRRGTDADRLQTDLCEGELGYSTDGTRIFVGDGSTNGGKSLGSSMIFKPESFNTTTLTAVSSDGRAEVGDFVFTHAANYNVTTINAAADSAVITPNNSFGTVYTLSAIDPSDGSLTWVPVNSAIPLNHIDIPDNGINGDKIHGGNISGNVTFSNNITALSSVSLSGVAISAENAAGLAGSIIYPLGITANAEVTAVSSIYSLGLNTGIGNSIGYVKAIAPATSTALSAINFNSNITKSSLGSSTTLLTNTAIGTYIGDFYAHTTTSFDNEIDNGRVTVNQINYSLANIQAAVGDTSNNINWGMIEEFYFSVYADHVDDSVCFFGYHNESIVDNEVVFFSGSSIWSGGMRSVPNFSRVIITNTYSSTESIKIHTGITHSKNGKITYILTGIKVRT